MSRRMLQFHSEASDWPLTLFPQGRCRFSYRTGNKEQANSYLKTINKLRDDGEYDILRAVQEEVFGIDHVHVVLNGQGSTSEALAQLRVEMAQASAGGVPTYERVLERYLNEYSPTCTPRTQDTHRAILLPFGRRRIHGREINEFPITELSHSDLAAALNGLDIAPSTREGYRGKLSGLWSWYMDWERGEYLTKGRPRLLQYNAPAEIARVRSQGEITTLDELQVLRILAVARPWERAAFQTIGELGLRANELIHLRLGIDVLLDEAVIKVQPRGPDPDHLCPDCRADGWSPKRPRKSTHDNNSIRTLHLPGEKQGLIAVLRRHNALWPVEHGDYFFQNPSVNSNGPWTYETLRSRFKKACEATEGVVRYGQKVQGGVTLHSLRHTCATEMILNGVPLSIVAKTLGHTVATLESTYSHIMDTDTRIGLAGAPCYSPTEGAEAGQDDASSEADAA